MKRKYLNKISKLAVVVAVISISSCKEDGGLAPEYMPDMYRSPSLETYVDYGELRGKQGNDSLINTMTARQPVKGTIPRGFMPYGYQNTPEDYQLAGQNLRNPIVFNEQIGAEGKELYGMFCVQCHGKTGQGDGSLIQNDKFPPLPVKFAPGLAISEGKMFHSITYGKGLMGAHASQLKKEERWKLIHYIRTDFMKESASEKVHSVGGNASEGTATASFTGDLGSDLDLIFNFFDIENPEYESLPSYSPGLVLEGVIFKQASAKLKIEESKSTLNVIAERLNSEAKKTVKILLSGHTHSGPNETLNVSLSEKRAKNVKEYLVGKGVDAARIQIKGYGSSQLLSTESGKEARVKNRRTEISAIK